MIFPLTKFELEKPWMKIKADVRNRDNHICQKCGLDWTQQNRYKRRFDIHHILPEQDGWLTTQFTDVSPELLITLCHKCHQNIKKMDYKILLKQVKIKLNRQLVDYYKKQIERD